MLLNPLIHTESKISTVDYSKQDRILSFIYFDIKHYISTYLFTK